MECQTFYLHSLLILTNIGSVFDTFYRINWNYFHIKNSLFQFFFLAKKNLFFNCFKFEIPFSWNFLFLFSSPVYNKRAFVNNFLSLLQIFCICLCTLGIRNYSIIHEAFFTFFFCKIYYIAFNHWYSGSGLLFIL